MLDNENMTTLEEKLDKIYTHLFGAISDIRENMVTKTEFETSKSEIINHIDGFIKLHETLDTELIALHSKI